MKMFGRVHKPNLLRYPMFAHTFLMLIHKLSLMRYPKTYLVEVSHEYISSVSIHLSRFVHGTGVFSFLWNKQEQVIDRKVSNSRKIAYMLYIIHEKIQITKSSKMFIFRTPCPRKWSRPAHSGSRRKRITFR